MNLRYVRSILICLFLLTSYSLCGQYTFRHWDIMDGLSDNQIRNFTMTDDSHLVIRTVSNVTVYNGANFEHYYQDRTRDYKWSFNKYQIFKEYHDSEGRMWMKSPGYLSVFDFNTNNYIYNVDSLLMDLGVDKKLSNLFIDQTKNYWFLTENNSLQLYDIQNKQLTVVDDGRESADTYGTPYELAQYKNLYYIVYSKGVIRCWDSASKEFTLLDSYFTDKITSATNRLNIIPTSTGDLWLMHNNAVCFYNRIEGKWEEIATIKGVSNFFTSMDLDKEGNVWVGTSWSGLRKIDAKSKKVEVIPGLRLSNGGILNNDIQCIYADSNGGLWIGTIWQGMCYYNPTMYKFGLIQSVQNKTLITNESVRSLLEDNNGDILIGTTNYGLMRYRPSTGEVSKAFAGILSNELCLSLYRDSKKRLWVGTYLNGFYCIDGQNVKNYNRTKANMELYPNQNISRAIFEDTDGRFWVSVSNEGIGELDLITGKISMLKDRHPKVNSHKLDYGFYPIDNTTFAVYGENGIYYYNSHEDTIFVPEIDDANNPKFAGVNTRYYCFYKDSEGLEWFGTDQGLRIWDEQKKTVYMIDINDGLPNNSVSSIEQDENNIYWISTVSGISKIEKQTVSDGSLSFELVNFDTEDGLQSGKFYDRSSLKSTNGTLYFGGHHGVNWFNPNTIKYNASQNKPVLTAFYLFDRILKPNVEYNGHTILKSPINNTSEITLNYDENFISIEFAGLNYVNPHHTFYKYKLENYDQEWREIKSANIGAATYTGLQPGEYKFSVYTANNDKLWGDVPAELIIKITPPLWFTIYAYIFYVVVFFFLAYAFVKYLNKRRTTRQERIEEEKRLKQKEELDQMKFRFFTNVSHEFRTPLTLIMTPLNTLIQQVENPLKGKLKAIYQNANDMLNLVNQLLDFRKVEMGGEKMKPSLNNFVDFAKYIHTSFQEMATSRNMTFSFDSEPSELYIQFDKQKMHKVFNNLYSNALKFTPDCGLISTTIQLESINNREYVSVQISDSGCGIDKSNLELIFDRFYQAGENNLTSTGSGIGLHLVKEYVLLHGGKIYVESEPNVGTTFTFAIPTDIVDEEVESLERQETPHVEQPSQKYKERKTLLVVEDNIELQSFLVEELSSQFNILKANDGVQGEKVALDKSPDLIISDLMMPLLDGLELCNRVKNNIHTSHIPFILLTARLSDETRIDSYKAGADSYISKPFNFEVLLARIEMLFEQQEKRKEFFNTAIEISPSTITISSLDEELVKKAVEYVEQNIDNPNYSVNQLSSDLAMSRTQLYRKFESIVGVTPNDFIRSVRLKRAAQLLRDTSCNISEISDIVGFNSIKYFNKYFKEQFGKTPTQYRAELSE